MPYVDSRRVIQVDVENHTNRVVEITVPLKSVGGREQQAVIAVLPQQAVYAPKHAGVVVDDIDQSSFRQALVLFSPQAGPYDAATSKLQAVSYPIGSA
jgi:hypothetical protein